nr:uncharacterized protein LOC118878606 isoform X2 [Drosophila suzukii]
MLIDQSWSLVLMGTYLNESTICIFWNDRFEFQLLHSAEYSSYVGINILNLQYNEGNDFINARLKKKWLQEKNVLFDDLLIKIIISIEVTHCESFLVFDDDIGQFVNAFKKASVYSIWRSIRNKFVFAYVANELHECWDNIFFEDQPNILFVVRDHYLGTNFDLKTNKYVGPKSEKPAQLKLLDTYLAAEQRFRMGKSLFPDKLKNLHGREVILAGFDYRPYTVIKNLNIWLTTTCIAARLKC